MFGRKRGAVVEPLASVSAVTALVAEIESRHAELSKLLSGLGAAEEERQRLTLEEREQKDAMYRHAARALVNPEQQAEADRCHERARACGERLVELERQIPAIESQIHHTERGLERLRNDLIQARRGAWMDILEQLLSQFGDEQRELLFKAWTALDAVYNGAPAEALFQRLGITELDTATKLRMLDVLCDAYEMPKH